jgi:predicted nuclease of restriction endonuclease-like (RecB) superfamily
MSTSLENTDSDFNQILLLIKEAKNRVYAKANKELVLLYFNVGKVVSEKVNTGNWGDKTVQELADFIASKQPELTGFNRRGLYRMKQFFETYSDPKIVRIVSTALTQIQQSDNQVDEFVSTVLTQIQWSSHLHILNKTKTIEEKTFYILQAISQRLTVRELERQLNTSTFERTLLSDKIVSSVSTKLPQNIFKDPYIFEFLTLPDGHSEKDFEKAIVLNLQKFILEVGKGFTYMGHQYRLQVGNRDYYTDLLFYHRDLQCLVLFELKIQEFEPEFLGKLNFYLEALDRDVKRPSENPSIGILLCKGKDTEVVEYAMARNTSPAVIAEYQTKLIDKQLLANKLHQLAEILNKHIDQ